MVEFLEQQCGWRSGIQAMIANKVKVEWTRSGYKKLRSGIQVLPFA